MLFDRVGEKIWGMASKRAYFQIMVETRRQSKRSQLDLREVQGSGSISLGAHNSHNS